MLLVAYAGTESGAKRVNGSRARVLRTIAGGTKRVRALRQLLALFRQDLRIRNLLCQLRLATIGRVRWQVRLVRSRPIVAFRVLALARAKTI